MFSNDNQRVTATFESWQEALDKFTELAIGHSNRLIAKDAMVCMQKIIIACRESRKYQRDTIPPDTEITVHFPGEEWRVARATLLTMNMEELTV